MCGFGREGVGGASGHPAAHQPRSSYVAAPQSMEDDWGLDLRNHFRRRRVEGKRHPRDRRSPENGKNKSFPIL